MSSDADSQWHVTCVWSQSQNTTDTPLNDTERHWEPVECRRAGAAAATETVTR